MKKILTVWVALFCMSSLYAQGGAVSFVQANSQHAFPDRIPAGNYSGICRIDSNLYAVVSDKSAHEGFFVFRVGINPQNAVYSQTQADVKMGEILNGGDLFQLRKEYPNLKGSVSSIRQSQSPFLSIYSNPG